MNRYSVKAAACALVGTLSLSGYQTTLEAKLNHSSDVPAAGVAVVLDDSSTIQDLQVEVVQNIAYLESASGLQPNIVLASEKVALTEAPSSVVMSNTKKATAKVSTEFVQELSEAISEIETEFIESDTSEFDEESSSTYESERETFGWGTLEQEAVETETSLRENSSELVLEEKDTDETRSDEEISEQEPGIQETTEVESFHTESSESESSVRETTDIEHTTESSSEEETTESSTEDDFETSAGFSALDTYDDVEVESEDETETEIETETQEDAQDFSGLVIARVTNYVNVRSLPSEEGEIVGKLYDKSVGEFIEEKDGWYKIVSGNCTGYVKGEYCVVGEEAEALAKEVGTTYAIVNTTTLKVRQEASTESSVLGLVPIEEELVVVEELDGWV